MIERPVPAGIWPESKAFIDEGLGAIPSGWKGFCQSGDQFNASKHCNKKLIGARWFVDGFLAQFGPSVNLTRLGEFLSARDADGHGTHVSSTAAGAYVANVSYNGVGLGTARGGAPRARLAIYKVCWKVQNGLCASADILKGFDEAIKDGVHVLTLSIAASSLPLYSEVDGRDAIAIGSFHAVRKGIPVVCGAGNNGPSPQTVKNTAPWIITVAASTMDRAFATQITLGNNKTFLVSNYMCYRRCLNTLIDFGVTEFPRKNESCRAYLSIQEGKATLQACSTLRKQDLMLHRQGTASKNGLASGYFHIKVTYVF